MVDTLEEDKYFQPQYISTTGKYELIDHAIDAKKPANALAKMLIYLIENKLMELK